MPILSTLFQIISKILRLLGHILANLWWRGSPDPKYSTFIPFSGNISSILEAYTHNFMHRIPLNSPIQLVYIWDIWLKTFRLLLNIIRNGNTSVTPSDISYYSKTKVSPLSAQKGDKTVHNGKLNSLMSTLERHLREKKLFVYLPINWGRKILCYIHSSSGTESSSESETEAGCTKDESKSKEKTKGDSESRKKKAKKKKSAKYKYSILPSDHGSKQSSSSGRLTLRLIRIYRPLQGGPTETPRGDSNTIESKTEKFESRTEASRADSDSAKSKDKVEEPGDKAETPREDSVVVRSEGKVEASEGQTERPQDDRDASRSKGQTEEESNRETLQSFYDMPRYFFSTDISPSYDPVTGRRILDLDPNLRLHRKPRDTADPDEGSSGGTRPNFYDLPSGFFAPDIPPFSVDPVTGRRRVSIFDRKLRLHPKSRFKTDSEEDELMENEPEGAVSSTVTHDSESERIAVPLKRIPSVIEFPPFFRTFGPNLNTDNTDQSGEPIRSFEETFGSFFASVNVHEGERQRPRTYIEEYLQFLARTGPLRPEMPDSSQTADEEQPHPPSPPHEVSYHSAEEWQPEYLTLYKEYMIRWERSQISANAAEKTSPRKRKVMPGPSAREGKISKSVSGVTKGAVTPEETSPRKRKTMLGSSKHERKRSKSISKEAAVGDISSAEKQISIHALYDVADTEEAETILADRRRASELPAGVRPEEEEEYRVAMSMLNNFGVLPEYPNEMEWLRFLVVTSRPMFRFFLVESPVNPAISAWISEYVDRSREEITRDVFSMIISSHDVCRLYGPIFRHVLYLSSREIFNVWMNLKLFIWVYPQAELLFKKTFACLITDTGHEIDPWLPEVEKQLCLRLRKTFKVLSVYFEKKSLDIEYPPDFRREAIDTIDDTKITGPFGSMIVEQDGQTFGLDYPQPIIGPVPEDLALSLPELRTMMGYNTRGSPGIEKELYEMLGIEEEEAPGTPAFPLDAESETSKRKTIFPATWQTDEPSMSEMQKFLEYEIGDGPNTSGRQQFVGQEPGEGTSISGMQRIGQVDEGPSTSGMQRIVGQAGEGPSTSGVQRIIGQTVEGSSRTGMQLNIGQEPREGPSISGMQTIVRQEIEGSSSTGTQQIIGQETGEGSSKSTQQIASELQKKYLRSLTSEQTGIKVKKDNRYPKKYMPMVRVTGEGFAGIVPKSDASASATQRSMEQETELIAPTRQRGIDIIPQKSSDKRPIEKGIGFFAALEFEQDTDSVLQKSSDERPTQTTEGFLARKHAETLSQKQSREDQSSSLTYEHTGAKVKKDARFQKKFYKKTPESGESSISERAKPADVIQDTGVSQIPQYIEETPFMEPLVPINMSEWLYHEWEEKESSEGDLENSSEDGSRNGFKGMRSTDFVDAAHKTEVSQGTQHSEQTVPMKSSSTRISDLIHSRDSQGKESPEELDHSKEQFLYGYSDSRARMISNESKGKESADESDSLKDAFLYRPSDSSTEMASDLSEDKGDPADNPETD